LLVLSLFGGIALTARVDSAARLTAASTAGASLGVWAIPSDSSTLSAQQDAVRDLETRIGGKLAIGHNWVRWGQGLGELPAWHSAQGRTPLISFGLGANTREVAAGRHDAYLQGLARSIRSLGAPVLLRYGPGMDSEQRRAFTVSGRSYVAAWRHVRGLFAAEGVDGSWVWSPNADAFAGARGGVQQYWPGNGQVDWIAANGFNNETCGGGAAWKDFGGIFRPFYDWASARKKPLMIAEVGTVEDPADAGRKAGWFGDAVGTLAGSMPRVRAVVYDHGQTACDWRLDSSAQSMDGFVKLARDPFFGGTGGPAPSSSSTTSSSSSTSTTTTTQPPATTAPPTTAAAAAAYPCSGVSVSPGDNLQARLDANPEGATFCLAPGTYRLSSALAPKRAQKLIGAPGAVLNGSRVVSGFQFTGSVYVATGFLPSSPAAGPGSCREGVQGCTYTQDVFLDDRPLRRVASLANLSSGTFYEDFGANRIYLKDSPSGHLVEQAYAPGIVQSYQASVTVKGLVAEKAANPAQSPSAAVRLGGAGSVVEGNEIRLNHGTGVGVQSSGTLRDNHIHHNGQLGMAASGANVLVEGNEVAYNNYAGYNWFWEAGGSKFCFTSDLVVRGNHAHHNRGPGLWTDIDNIRTLYERNRATGNLGAGIKHEISYDAVVRDNVLEGNVETDYPGWGGQLFILASPNVQVYGNLMKGPDGVSLAQASRGSGKYGAYELRNISVHDNAFSGTSAQGLAAGLVKNVSDDSYYSSRNIVFRHNTYHLPSLSSRYFYWDDRALTAAEWRSAGQDTDGAFDTNVAG
jgi:hypothetical protein